MIRSHSSPGLAYTFTLKLWVVRVCAEAEHDTSSEVKATNSTERRVRMPATQALQDQDCRLQ